VVKRLAELAPKYPYQTVRALGIIFDTDKDGWAIYGWDDAPQVIVDTALKGDVKSRKKADHVVNKLVARGHRQFRGFATMKAPKSLSPEVYGACLPL
jgi:hypothetical protein